MPCLRELEKYQGIHSEFHFKDELTLDGKRMVPFDRLGLGTNGNLDQGSVPSSILPFLIHISLPLPEVRKEEKNPRILAPVQNPFGSRFPNWNTPDYQLTTHPKNRLGENPPTSLGRGGGAPRKWLLVDDIIKKIPYFSQRIDFHPRGGGFT